MTCPLAAGRGGAAALLGAVLLMACASRGPEASRDQLRRQIAGRGLDPEHVIQPTLLNDEMREWLYRKLPPQGSEFERLLKLLDLMGSRGGLALQYRAGYTGTAAEVFASREYNCLSFSNLFLAFARELGIPAQFLAVDRLRRYERQGDLVVVSGHITVGYGTGLDRKVLQFDVGPQVSYRGARPISDLRALALFYANRGAEKIREGRLEEARQWLETGTRLDPGEPSNWVNLGVARRRLGDEQGAEEAYMSAIRAEPEFVPAYSNLAALLRLRGEASAAEALLERIGRRGNRSPYVFLALGDSSLDKGLVAEAETYYRRALRLADNRAEPMAALGLLALAAGDAAEAERWLAKARPLDDSAPRVLRLAEALEPGQRREADTIGRFQGGDG